MPTPDLSNVNVVVAVFHMPQCPSCDRYMPELKAAVARARRAGHPFVFSNGVTTPSRGQIPIISYDVSQNDPEVIDIATRYHVDSTPTTVVLLRGPGTFKVEGALTANQIDHLLAIAAANNG